MGPYEIKGTNGSPFVEYMMCFNAGAIASAGPALATDNAGASAIFGSRKDQHDFLARVSVAVAHHESKRHCYERRHQQGNLGDYGGLRNNRLDVGV